MVCRRPIDRIRIQAARANVMSAIIPATGGEAKQATDSKTGVTSFRIARIGSASPTRRWTLRRRAEEKAKKDKNDARVVDEDIKMSRLYVTWLADERGVNETLLTKGHFNVPAAGRAGYDWSPDSTTIVYACTLTPTRTIGRAAICTWSTR